MQASRTITRAVARNARVNVRANTRGRVRYYATETQKVGGSSGLVGGIAGGAVVFLAGYSYYYFSGAKTVVNAASATKSQFKSLQKQIQSSAPEPNQALKWLRDTATSYAAFIPGAKAYVDSAFDDLDKVQSKHGGEVEEIVQRTYKEVKEATKKGVDMQSATKVWQILEKAITDLGELAKDSAGEILDQHPQIKEKVGGNIDQLKQMADQYGPEAKKELDDVYKRISDMVKGGVGVGSVEELRKLVEEKMEKVGKLGDEAWKKGLEQAKPYLDKNPKIKEIVESNASALKSGNITELFQQVKEAASSGNTDKLQEYVKQAGEKAKNSGMGQSIEQYAKMIPGGSEILPKLQKLQEVARKKGDDAERILKGAYEDVQEVLQKRIKEAEKLADEAGKEAKN